MEEGWNCPLTESVWTDRYTQSDRRTPRCCLCV